jgi:molybdate transport system ATP-binding protein
VSGLSARIVVPRAHFSIDVALEAGDGESVAVMGPSGAGKSSILGAVAGLVPIERGEIRIAGRLVDRAGEGARRLHVPPMRRGVVLLGQDPRLFPHLTVGENVAFGPRAAGRSRADAARAADAWLARVGLPGAGRRHPAELSGGEQQRVAVARALAAEPGAVLLDEPLVALDPVTAADIRAMLRAQLTRSTTLAVTHDAADAAALADRLVVVEDGRVRQSGAVREVLAAPATAFAAAIAGLNRLAGRARGGVLDTGSARLRSADPASRAAAAVDGAALAAVFRPADVRLEEAPDAWSARIDRIESTVAGLRVHADGCAVDLAAAAAVDLRPGDAVRLRVNPAHVRFVADTLAG